MFDIRNRSINQLESIQKSHLGTILPLGNYFNLLVPKPCPLMNPRLIIVVGLSLISYFLLIGYFADVAYPPVYTGVRNTSVGFLLAAILAIIGNIRIIHYHATIPPHPKFMLMPERKFWVRVHAITGSLEVILGIIAWITLDKNLALITAFIAIFGHVPSAYFQTPGVFGTRGIMVPSYYAVVTLHLYCAIRLVMEGGDIVWLERTWMALQAYAFVRIYGLLINNSGTFKESIYTVSVVLAGATITPFIMGPAGPITILFVVLIYLGFYKLIMKTNKEDWQHLFEEKERRSLIDPQMRSLWIARHLTTGLQGSSVENARIVFSHLDRNNCGSLTLEEVEILLKEWGASEEFKQAFFQHYGNSSGIDFHIFVNTIWISGRMQEQFTDAVAGSIREPEQQARFIFNHLDLDSSGKLELTEIELLLMEWGMDIKEVERYLKKFGGADGKIDFPEFYTGMKPVWKFGFSEVFS